MENRFQVHPLRGPVETSRPARGVGRSTLMSISPPPSSTTTPSPATADAGGGAGYSDCRSNNKPDLYIAFLVDWIRIVGLNDGATTALAGLFRSKVYLSTSSRDIASFTTTIASSGPTMAVLTVLAAAARAVGRVLPEKVTKQRFSFDEDDKRREDDRQATAVVVLCPILSCFNVSLYVLSELYDPSRPIADIHINPFRRPLSRLIGLLPWPFGMMPPPLDVNLALGRKEGAFLLPDLVGLVFRFVSVTTAVLGLRDHRPLANRSSSGAVGGNLGKATNGPGLASA